MPVTKDLRKEQALTFEEVDVLYLRAARAKAVIDRETAAVKAKKADLDLKLKKKIAPAEQEYAALVAKITEFASANPERFDSPRKHPVGEIGSYGLTTSPAYVEITDEEAYLDFARTNGYDDLFTTEYTPDKAGAAKRIAAGEEIPGARLVPAGDVVRITFRKNFAEQLDEA